MEQVSRTLMYVCFYDGDFETACMLGCGLGAVRVGCGVLCGGVWLYGFLVLVFL